MNDIEWQTPHPAVTEMYRTAIGEHLARLNELPLRRQIRLSESEECLKLLPSST